MTTPKAPKQSVPARDRPARGRPPRDTGTRDASRDGARNSSPRDSGAGHAHRTPPPAGADARTPETPPAFERQLQTADQELRRWVPPVASFLVLLSGVVDVISVLTPEIRSRLHAITNLVGGPVARSAAALSLMVGLLLILLSVALRKRKRRAWRGAVILLPGSALFTIVKGLDVEEAVLSLVVAALLIAYRSEFEAKSDPRSRWRAGGVFLAMLIASVVIGLLFVNLRVAHFVGSHSFGQQLQDVVYGLVGVHGPLHFRSDRVEDLYARILFGLGLVTVLTTVYLVFRPEEPVARLTATDEDRMRLLLAKHGAQDSLGYFALRRDKSVIWSPSGKSAVAYRVVSGVMLASGDPLGDTEAWTGAIECFLQTAREHAWTPAVMGCSEQGGTVWARAGLDALELGDEAVVEVGDFSLEGRSMRNVRQAVARVERAGYTFQARRIRDVDPDELARVGAAVKAWRGAETERGFSMALGRFGAREDGESVLATAHKDGELAAILHFVPWGPDGLSLDVMVRDRGADNGMNEFLIAKMLGAAPDLGVQRVSLNFAVFRAALARGERLGAGFVLRLWRNTLLLLSRWFQIESLYRFNAKFQPDWVPRYVCYPAARDLPRIAIAALEAEAFIVWPRFGFGQRRARRENAAHAEQ